VQGVSRECEWKVSGRRKGKGKGKGFPLQSPPPLDEHRLHAEESEIGRKGIELKARAQWRGTTLRSYTLRTEVTVDSSLCLNIYIKLFEKFDNML